MFHLLAVNALLNYFVHMKIHASFHRMAKLFNGFVCPCSRPDNVTYLGKVAPYQVRNITKHQQRLAVDMLNAKVGVNQVNANWCFINQGFKLRAALA